MRGSEDYNHHHSQDDSRKMEKITRSGSGMIVSGEEELSVDWCFFCFWRGSPFPRSQLYDVQYKIKELVYNSLAHSRSPLLYFYYTPWRQILLDISMEGNFCCVPHVIGAGWFLREKESSSYALCTQLRENYIINKHTVWKTRPKKPTFWVILVGWLGKYHPWKHAGLSSSLRIILLYSLFVGSFLRLLFLSFLCMWLLNLWVMVRREGEDRISL